MTCVVHVLALVVSVVSVATSSSEIISKDDAFRVVWNAPSSVCENCHSAFGCARAPDF